MFSQDRTTAADNHIIAQLNTDPAFRIWVEPSGAEKVVGERYVMTDEAVFARYHFLAKE